MAQLKSRQNQIPNGFKYRQAETGWTAPPWSSFETIVRGVMAHRMGNPALARKHKWAMDYETVAYEVDLYNAALCESHGWLDFVVSKNSEPPKFQPLQSERPGAGFVGAVKRSVTGIKSVAEWLGSGLKPVAQDVAEKRAYTCAKEPRVDQAGNPIQDGNGNIIIGCPLNVKGNWLQKLEANAADKVRSLMEVRNDLKLRTSNDSNLGSCAACDCALQLKIWQPMDLIQKNTNQETRTKLDRSCWILKGE